MNDILKMQMSVLALRFQGRFSFTFSRDKRFESLFMSVFRLVFTKATLKHSVYYWFHRGGTISLLKYYAKTPSMETSRLLAFSGA